MKRKHSGAEGSPTVRLSGRRAAGYSLIEVLVALGVLGGVLVTIGGLFFAGTRFVRSGREMTRAVVIAKSALEDVEAWPFVRVYAQAGAADDALTASWSTDSANPAFTGGTEDVARMTATADEWRDRVRTTLPRGALTYSVDGLRAFPTESDDGLASFQDARLVRVSVVVSWIEPGGRVRDVRMERLVQ